MMKLNIQRFASATFTGQYVEGNYSWAKIQGRVICEETYVGTSNENKSAIKCTVQARVTTGGTTAANWRIGVTCNGVTKTAKSPSNMTIDDSWVTINTLTFTDVAHNEDGSKVVAISGYAQAPEYPTSLGNAKSTFSGNMTLTTIPRATTLDSFSGSKRIGVTNDVIINFTKKSSSFTTTLAYATKSDYSDMTTIVEKSPNASTYAWTLPINLLNSIPNSKTLTIYVMLATFDGDTQIGTAQTSSFTANVYAENCKPIWNTHTIEETDITAKQLVTSTNKFIANLSKPKFTFEATGQYGATIKYYQVNNTTRTSGFTDSNFNTNGYTLKVVDSRGIENTYKFDLTYVPYFTPIFEEVKLSRDVPTSEKLFSYFKIKFFNNTSSVKFDNPQALSYKFNYQESGGTEQEKTITPETYDDGTSRYAENETELGNTFNYKKNVDWTFSFVDLSGKTFTTSNTLPMGIPLMNGKMNSDGEQELFVNGKATFNENVNVNGDITNTGNINNHGTVYGGAFSTGGNISAVGNIKGFINTTTKTLPSGTDGRDYWNYLPNGTYWYANSGSPANMPSGWGWVIKTGFEGSGDFNVMFYTQSSGNIYRKSGNSSSISGWVKIPLMNDITPVGSVFITSTNTNPNNLGLSGTWTLIDKEFSSVGPTNSAFTKKDTNTTAATPYWSRSGHTLNLEIVFTNKVQINDNTVIVGDWDLATLGVTRLNHGMATCGYTDAGNCMFMGYTNTLGEFSIVDLIPDSYISAGKTDNKIFLSVAIHKDYMLDSACDKFYWKRIS